MATRKPPAKRCRVRKTPVKRAKVSTRRATSARGGYEEYLYLDSRGMEDATVVREANSGKVLRVYAESRSSFLTPIRRGLFGMAPDLATTPKQRSLRWKKDRNPLYVNASDPVVAYGFLTLNGWTPIRGDGWDPWYRQ
jgi:hypothetical protein